MRNSNVLPTINAGSMADIAFLLLIFFLVSATIPNDKGIIRKLPPPCLSEDCLAVVGERNIFRILLNKNDELFINDALIPLESLSEALKDFIDNNGDGSCFYCKGKSLTTSSENPQKAIISLNASRESSYKGFMSIQVAVTKAYLELREDYAKEHFDKNTSELSQREVILAQEAYPLLLSEASLR